MSTVASAEVLATVAARIGNGGGGGCPAKEKHKGGREVGSLDRLRVKRGLPSRMSEPAETRSAFQVARWIRIGYDLVNAASALALQTEAQSTIWLRHCEAAVFVLRKFLRFGSSKRKGCFSRLITDAWRPSDVRR
jgi:hypothetical protein